MGRKVERTRKKRDMSLSDGWVPKEGPVGSLLVTSAVPSPGRQWPGQSESVSSVSPVLSDL